MRMFKRGWLQRCATFAAIALVLAAMSYPARAEESERDAEAAGLVALATALEHGEGVQKDETQALALYCEAARQGDAEAQFSIGWMYANSRGIPRNDAIASYFFGLAAGQGHEHAQRIQHLFGPSASDPPDCMRPPRIEAQAIEDEALPQVDDMPPAPKYIADLVGRLAPQYNVQPRLALAVIRAESNFDPNARSVKNAQGLMQLIPETARRFNVRKPFDPEQNVRGGLAYLRWLLSYFRGQVPLVVAGYNAGEGAVDRYRGIPPFPETREYVQRIMSIYRSEMHPFERDVSGRFSLVRYPR
ncbi:transglycosylase SLT domain-containing protein [Accumulibacter sp.]|uniref:transglycosylase SLT domain-containing protein n=1 Tax=Accumulibacter sp. TaxID=2053492 RepID=UPI002CF93261|nr:transglycosylase SLT domain-containing protein [Accumulibacter sp.]HNB68936.1 transglycosylase SLT domain-containing protein [Accumulibacter sp.]